MYITDLLDVRRLLEDIAEGYVTRRPHPEDPSMVIYNYTPKAQNERSWTRETTTCRGLIVDGSGTVVARPLRKFFNFGEHLSPESSLTLWSDTPVDVYDKVDGSLGILYTAPDGLPAIATRGSFASEQAVHATQALRRMYPTWREATGYTDLFEIIYPDNQIVLDYAGLDDLVYLGSVRNDTGNFFPEYRTDWTGPRAARIAHGTTLESALELPDRENKEGLVVVAQDGSALLKIKQADYVAVHRIVGSWRRDDLDRKVWEMLRDGTFDDIAHRLPTYWRLRVVDIADRILAEVRRIFREATDLTITLLWRNMSRKEIALHVKESPLAPIVFGILDGRDVTPLLWKVVRP